MSKGGISLWTKGFARFGTLFGTAYQLKPGRTFSASGSVLASDSGTVMLVTGVDLVISLPATQAGFLFSFILLSAALSAGTGLSISPVAADNIYGNGLTAVDNKDVILAGAGDRAGDNITLYGDGLSAGGYNILNVNGTWTKEA